LTSIPAVQTLQIRRNGRYPILYPLIGCGHRGERGGGEANAVVGSIKDGIEPLKESEAVDKVEARSGGEANVVDD